MAIEFFADGNTAATGLPFSSATRAGGFVFVSGQVAKDDRGAIVEGGIESHTRQTMNNVVRALALAGCTLQDVIKTTVWLADAKDFGEFNAVYAQYFPGNKPARSTTQATLVVPSKVEIEVIAYKP